MQVRSRGGGSSKSLVKDKNFGIYSAKRQTVYLVLEQPHAVVEEYLHVIRVAKRSSDSAIVSAELFYESVTKKDAYPTVLRSNVSEKSHSPLLLD